MGNFKKVFIIGFVGGLVGYACGAMFTPTRAIAQQIEPADGGMSQNDPGDPATTADAGPAPQAAAGGPAPACRQWEVKFGPSVFGQGYNALVTIDEGWEPYAFSDNWGSPVIRRCIR